MSILCLFQFTTAFFTLKSWGLLRGALQVFNAMQINALLLHVTKIVGGPEEAPKARGPLGIALIPATVCYATTGHIYIEVGCYFLAHRNC